jgi:microcin C transport system ATP-binding protein
MRSTPERVEMSLRPASERAETSLRVASDSDQPFQTAPQVPLLELRELSISFIGTRGESQVVDRVSLSVRRGEKFALVGESGSGKTVTALSLLRLNLDARYQGQILFEGTDLLRLSDQAMRGLRGRDIGMVFQEPMSALNPLFTVGDQIGEVLQRHEGLSRAAARARAIELLALTQVPEPQRRVDAYPHELSGGQRQRVVIAMALACRPKLLIADEPTTALDVTIQRQIIALLDDLQREFGMSLLLITHDLPLVKRFADRVAVMRHGRVLEAGAVDQVFTQPAHAYTRELLDSRPRRMIDHPPDTAAPAVLAAQSISCRFSVGGSFLRRRWFEAVRGADLQLRPGETLGIVGESGSGKTTLGMSLLRLSAAQTTGQIRLHDQAIDALPQTQLRVLRAGMQVVFQDPYNALSPRMTIGAIVGEGLALHQPQLQPSERRDAVVSMLEEVGLTAEMLDRYPHEFSGGQRQRIAIARAVILKPALLLLDEPTSALDVSVQQQVLQLLVSLQRKFGMSYLFITHDLAVIEAMAHRVVVMKDGQIVETGDTQRVFEQPQHEYTRALLASAG